MIHPLHRAILGALFVAPIVLIQGCSLPKRDRALPPELSGRAVIPGIPGARVWGDDVPAGIYARFTGDEEHLKEKYPGIYGQEHNYLAISGGGPDGAFGAGLLCGWTEAGDRPEFTMVSGISTGALIAPFAFLGPEYDHELRTIYTKYSTDDLLKKRSIWKIVRSDAAFDTSPMVKRISEHYTQEVLDAIGVQAKRGRTLLIGTTNLDARRPVIWNIGRIALSGSPDRLKLFQDVILASAAVPAAFPPVYFEVEANGERYFEMHVDGGATSQLFLYPLGLDWGAVVDALAVPGRPRVFTIRNSSLSAEYQVVDPTVFHITGFTMGSLMRTGGFGDMYRVYLATLRDELDYHLAYIKGPAPLSTDEPFDTEYMVGLFHEAYSMAKDGYPWDRTPPGFVVDPMD